ncbi:hypothetical protein NU195Hw_g8627t1 [Hortaea werneckii]
MSHPRLTQTNHFGSNDRGVQIGNLENAFFNLSMNRNLTGSEDGSDVEVELRCLRSLASGQIYIDGKSDKKVPGTGDWVLENEVYKAWQQDGGVLWIKGRAGCGKSMLINHLSSEAKRQALEIPNPIVLSHSFVFGKAESLQRSPDGLFRALLHQILAIDRDLLARFTRATKFALREKQQGQAGIAWDWSSSELQEQLNDICKHKFRQPGKACLYVDCLDACSDEDATEVLEWLISLTSETGNGLRICFSSRPYPMWKFEKLMCLNLEELNQSDMVAFLKYHLQKLEKPALRGDAVKEEDISLIKGRLLNRASSVFQWLKYATRQAAELLQSGESVNYVLNTLERCPQDLHDIYASIVEQIPREEAEVAFRLLEWITLLQAPLSVEALRHAICIDRPYRKGASIHDFKSSNKHWCENDKLLVLRAERLTRGLVRPQKIMLVYRDVDPVPKKAELQVLQHDHESVLEFFVTRGLQMLASRMGTEFTLSRSHLRFTQRCLAYLLTKEGMSTAIKEGRSQYVKEKKIIARAMEQKSDKLLRALFANKAAHTSPSYAAASVDAGEATPPAAQLLLTGYALKHWRTHYLGAESDDAVVDECLNFLQSVCGPDLWKLETWCNPFRWKYCTQVFDGRDRVVDILCSLGLVNTLNRLLSRQDQQNEPTRTLGGWREMLNTQDQYGVTPLIAAIGSRSRSTVKLLLQHGVSASVPDRHGVPPILHAVVSGQADVVDLLLARSDIDSDQRGSVSWNPLIVALCLAIGNDGAEKLHILESLARSTKQKVHSIANPIHPQHPDLPPTQEMLEAGWPHIPSNTPLAMAFLSGSGNVLKSLLKCPLIDPSAQDSQGRTLAHYIAACKLSDLADASTEELVERSRILFDSGRIALDTKDSQGDTPLAVAVLAGDTHIVSMLLAKEEVEANSKNNWGLTPFLIASRAGKVEILKILLVSHKIDHHAVDYKGKNALANAVVGGVFEALAFAFAEDPQLASASAEDPIENNKAERVGIYELLIRSSKVCAH